MRQTFVSSREQFSRRCCALLIRVLSEVLVFCFQIFEYFVIARVLERYRYVLVSVNITDCYGFTGKMRTVPCAMCPKRF